MKALPCAIALSLLSSALTAFHVSARPLEPDFPCYMRTTAGRVVDLTPAMCRASVSTTLQVTSAAPLSANTSAFIREYRKRAALVENRAAARLLIAEADQSPDAKTAKANAVCNALSNGLSEQQIKATNDKVIPTESQDTLRHAAGLADIQILITLAGEGFCPGAADQSVANDDSSGSRSSGGICNTPEDRQRNGNRCGKTAASERPGGR